MSRFPIICVVLLSASSALAQSTTTGAISGRVTDAGSKEPMVGVTVVIQSETGGDPQTTLTDADGGYKITELIPGTYSVSFIDDTASCITFSLVCAEVCESCASRCARLALSLVVR